MCDNDNVIMIMTTIMIWVRAPFACHSVPASAFLRAPQLGDAASSPTDSRACQPCLSNDNHTDDNTNTNTNTNTDNNNNNNTNNSNSNDNTNDNSNDDNEMGRNATRERGLASTTRSCQAQALRKAAPAPLGPVGSVLA